MKQVTINLYTFSELCEESQQKAISEHLDFLDSVPEEYENEAGQMVSEYVEHTELYAVASIMDNNYLFFPDGEIAHTRQFTGGHPKSGTAELYFHGETYIL